MSKKKIKPYTPSPVCRPFRMVAFHNTFSFFIYTNFVIIVRLSPFWFGVGIAMRCWTVKKILVIALLLAILAGSRMASGQTRDIQAQFEQPYPIHGWRVCADLGVGSPPGMPGMVQIMELCQGEGWRIRAYCLEPLEPPPPLDTFCSLVGERTFWCGDQYQLLREFIILDTPSPPDTATATSTPTPTNTPTLTASPTPLPSLTRTPIPSLTQTIGLTQSLTPPQIQQTPTVYDRPYPGGEGNRRVAGWLAGIASALTLIGIAGLAFSWRLPSRG